MLKWSKRTFRNQSQKSTHKTPEVPKLVPPSNNNLVIKRRSHKEPSNSSQSSLNLRSSKTDANNKTDRILEQILQQMGDFKKEMSGIKQELAGFKQKTQAQLEELKESRIQSKNNASQ